MLMEKNIREHNIKRSGLKLFGLTYLTFLIFNIITTWWLWYSTVFGMFFAIIVNALLMTLVFFIYHKVALKARPNIALFFLLVFWISFEKFHLGWDFSWPWLNLGNGFSGTHKWIQWYEYTGVFGGTLWVWIVNIGIFKVISNYLKNQNKKVLLKGLLFNVAIIVLGIYGSLYLYNKEDLKTQDFVNVVVLQPNIDPYTEKYKISNIETAKNLIAMANSAIDSTTDFIIAPETTFSKFILRTNYRRTDAYKMLQAYSNKKDVNIIAGYSFYTIYTSFKQPTTTANRVTNSKNKWYDMYNSASYISPNNSPQIYYKSKLVVGIELFPYKNILQPIFGESLINLGGAVTSLGTQKERDIFTSDNFSAAPIICYESIYGNFVNDYVRNGANFLAVITNDGWWDNSQGHKQHLMLSKLRAIENRRSLARSANTGVSAIINTKGDIVKRLDYGTKGIIKAKLSLNNKFTFYNRYGDYIARLSQFISVFLILSVFLRKRSTNAL